MYKAYFKSVIDIFLSLLIIVILSPLFVFVTILLIIGLRETPYFLQDRPGKNGRIFKLVKFKTMVSIKDENGELLSDAERITRLGRMLRKLSLDELPQLLNVTKGEMSLVGPRPLLVEYLKLYSKEQFRRHSVKPGITGWAQVNGRNNITWLKKFEYDVWYVDNISFSLDLKIFLKTIRKVALKSDVNKESLATTDAFNGHN
jgi:undecaprenyl phosphate N,N'-diacetylbacillosamine 1-phosphate transferase